MKENKRKMRNGEKAKVIAITAALTAAISLTAFTGGWTSRQETLHNIAEQARALGLPEDSPIIVEASRLWWEDVEAVEVQLDPPIVDNGYTEEDLCILAKVIWKEAGGCPWEHQCAVGAVVMNRVHDERFPDTISEVVGQPGQYSASYLSGFDNIPTECYDAARAVLTGEYTIPPEIVWQANFPQGSGIWWVSCVDTGWYKSTTYFCF